jgi:hypothetical protein
VCYDFELGQLEFDRKLQQPLEARCANCTVPIYTLEKESHATFLDVSCCVSARNRVLQFQRFVGQSATRSVPGTLGLAERHPEDVDLALVQSRLSPPSLAGIATLQRALEAHPAEPELWLELARSEWISGSQEAARFAAKRAGQLLGRDTPPGERYARMCAELPCTQSDPKEGP